MRKHNWFILSFLLFFACSGGGGGGGGVDSGEGANGGNGVNRPPVLNPIGSKTVNEGKTLQFTVTASDPDGDSLIYSASNLPTGANFYPATQTFIWTPTYGQAGNYPSVLFMVTDSRTPPQSASELITITVGGNGGTEIPVSIIWIDEPQTLITYVYSGGRLSAVIFHRNFNVVAGSGDIQISANLKDTLDSTTSIDQIEDTFYVEEGREYEIIVDVSIAGQIRCTPSNYDFMIFSSPSATEAIETAISPMLEGDPTTNQIDAFCLNGYVINSIGLNPQQ